MSKLLNAEQHFSQAPLGETMNRSTFDRSGSWKGTSDAGDLNCMFCDEILPGDDISMRVTQLTRMTTPLFPVMDDAFLDQYFFFVPMRLVWENTKPFFGETNESAWSAPYDITIPKIDIKTGVTRAAGDLPHQFGLPLSVAASWKDVNALPFRAYRLIWNEWFRDQNLQYPKLINYGDTETDLTLLQKEKVCRIHDYFGSCLPGQQKGDPISVALQGIAHVMTSDEYSLSDFGDDIYTGIEHLNWVDNTGTQIAGRLVTADSSGINKGTFVLNGPEIGTSKKSVPDNLIIDFNKEDDSLAAITNPESRIGIDISALRTAFSLQRCLEKLGRSGSRYTEMIRAFFGTISPDARQQRPELVGYSRQRLLMSEVQQNNAVDAEDDITPLGTIGAYSKTVDGALAFSKGFTEHGYLIGLFCIRHNRTYSQGIHRMWTRSNMFDFYLPTLAHISEQPVYTKELYAADDTVGEEDIFGYQEAWAEYRFGKNVNTGLMDPAVSGSLGQAWTYGDVYAESPTLSSGWIQEGKAEIQRTLAVEDEPQFMHDFYFDYKHTRVMPTYSVPGLVDHF